MGQLALGFRSLLIKAAVFVVLAALLAWALGGTLWPRPQVAEMDRVNFSGSEWYWQLAVGGARNEPSWVRWTMMHQEPGSQAVPVSDEHWLDAAGPVATDEALYYAGLPGGEDNGEAYAAWVLTKINGSGQRKTFAMPDRLAVEQQMARLRAGLPLQHAETILHQRNRVVDPADDELPSTK